VLEILRWQDEPRPPDYENGVVAMTAFEREIFGNHKTTRKQRVAAAALGEMRYPVWYQILPLSGYYAGLEFDRQATLHGRAVEDLRRLVAFCDVGDRNFVVSVRPADAADSCILGVGVPEYFAIVRGASDLQDAMTRIVRQMLLLLDVKRLDDHMFRLDMASPTDVYDRREKVKDEPTHS